MKPLLLIAIIACNFFTLNSAIGSPCNRSNSLVSVVKRKVGRTEYVIFTIKKPVSAASSFSVVSPPFTNGASGAPVKVKGCKYRQVRFNGIEWTCTIHEAINSSSFLIKQIKKTGQFEGVITYIIGYSCSTKSVVNYSYDSGAYRKFVVRLKY